MNKQLHCYLLLVITLLFFKVIPALNLLFGALLLIAFGYVIHTIRK